MKRFLIPFLAFPLLALLCAWGGNALASSRRRLAWVPTPAPAPSPAPPRPADPVAAADPNVPPRPVTGPARPFLAQAPSPALRPGPKPSAGTNLPSAVPTVAPVSAAQRFPFDPDHLEREISSEDALEAFRLGVPFFDARRSAEFEAGHLPGAHSAPVWEDGLQDRLAAMAARPGFPPRSARLTSPIVVYCSGGTCEDSHLLAEQLMPLGFGTILIYQGGFPDWQAKRRPVALGPEAP